MVSFTGKLNNLPRQGAHGFAQFVSIYSASLYYWSGIDAWTTAHSKRVYDQRNELQLYFVSTEGYISDAKVRIFIFPFN